jgi:hypothetical protein
MGRDIHRLPFGMFFTLALALCAANCFGDDNSVVCQLIPESNEILPFTPLHCWLQLENTGDEIRRIEVSLPGGIEYRKEGKAEWQPYGPFGLPQACPTPPMPIDLQPKEIRRWREIVYVRPPIGDGQVPFPVFETPGETVLLRAWIGTMKSTEVPVRVILPNAADAKACAALKKHPELISCFTEYIQWIAGDDKQAMAACRQFYADYAGTTYGYLAATGIALYELKGPGRAQALDTLKSYATNAPYGLRLRACWYYVEYGKVDDATVLAMLKTASQLEQDNYFSALVKDKIAALEARLSSTQH